MRDSSTADNMILVVGWALVVLNFILAAYLYDAHQRVDCLSQEFIQAKQHFERWQKTADHLLQENGYEPITPLLADK